MGIGFRADGVSGLGLGVYRKSLQLVSCYFHIKLKLARVLPSSSKRTPVLHPNKLSCKICKTGLGLRLRLPEKGKGSPFRVQSSGFVF